MNLWKRIKRRPIGLWLAVAVVVGVCGWRLVAAWQMKPLLDRTDEIARISKVRLTVYPNSAGTEFIYCQSTDTGIGVRHYDAQSGARTLLDEMPDHNINWLGVNAIGWSPGDLFFAYFLPEGRKAQDGNLVIRDGKTREVVGLIPANKYNLLNADWLSPTVFAYKKGENRLRVIEYKKGGNWVEKHLFRGVFAGKARDLVATSASSVVWRETNVVWTFNLETLKKAKVWEATTNVLVGLSYSKATRQLLLVCRDAEGRMSPSPIFEPDAAADPEAQATEGIGGTSLFSLDLRSGRTQIVARVGDAENPVNKAIWVNRGAGYAYLIEDMGGFSSLFVKADADSDPVRVLEPGGVEPYLSTAGSKVFFAGTASNEPPGIWSYDCASKPESALQPIVGPSEHTLVRASMATPSIGVLTNATGQTLNYRVWLPQGVPLSGRHPLVLGQTHTHSWQHHPQYVANAGCYFAQVESNPEVQSSWWYGDILALYDTLSTLPGVDTNNVFLFSISADSYPLCALLAEHPGRWKGAILYSGLATPDVRIIGNPRILVLVGDRETEVIERFTEWQDRASWGGIDADFVITDNTGHSSAANATRRSRARQIVRFLSLSD